MSASTRDRDALDLVARRDFSGASVASFELENGARRLTLVLYGTLRGSLDGGTFLGTLTFFGVSALAIANGGGTFPESVALATCDLTYADAEDVGTANLVGRAGWSIAWNFDGLSYLEVAATLASLADDL